MLNFVAKEQCTKIKEHKKNTLFILTALLHCAAVQMTGCGQSAVLIAVSEIKLGTPAARPQQPSSPVQDCWKIEDDQIEVEKFIQNDKLVHI